MKKCMLLMFLLFLGVTICQAQEDSTFNESLLRLKVVEHDSLRFGLYEEFVNESKNNPEQRIKYIDMMLRDAVQQNNEKYIAKAYLFYIFYEYNAQNISGIKLWLDKLEPLARKNKDYDCLFMGKECLADLLANNNLYEQSEQKGLEIQQEAQEVNSTIGIIIGYKCLANVYNGTYREKKAVELLKKAYKLSTKIEDGRIRLEIVTYIMQIYQMDNNYPEWIKYLRIREKEVIELIKTNPSYKGDLLLLYLSYLRYYTQTDNPERAKFYKELADKYYSDEYVLYQFNYYGEMMNYYDYIKEWNKALEETDKQLELVKKYLFSSYPVFLNTKARILNKMGLNAEALNASKEALFVKDTMLLSVYKNQIEQIRSNANNNQYLLQQARNRRSFQSVILCIIAIFIVVFCGLAHKSYKMHKWLKKSEQEIRRMAAEEEKASKIKEHFLSNISYAIQIPLNKVVDNSLLLASDKGIIDNKEREKIAKTILDTSDNLMILIEEILDLSRLESGRMRFSLSDIDVNPLIRDVVVANVAEDQREFVSQYSQTEQILVSVDGQRLCQVLKNLLVYSSGKVRIEVSRKDKETVSVEITNPALVSSSNTFQEIAIRNEINRMIIEYFGGRYEIKEDRVLFTLKTTKGIISNN